jgi:hypothetical protein
MEKIKVNITYNKYSKRYYATACGGRFTLCNFHRSEVSEKTWYFDAGFMRTGNKFLSYEDGEEIITDTFTRDSTKDITLWQKE